MNLTQSENCVTTWAGGESLGLPLSETASRHRGPREGLRGGKWVRGPPEDSIS